MDRKSLSWLLDVLVAFVFFVIGYIVVGYGMDLAAGAERNPIMDRAVVVGALMSVFFLSVWYYRK